MNTELTYHVVINEEEQYSIWPTHKETPRGWSVVGKEGSKSTCLDFINNEWKDMRPSSLRKKLLEK
ncbi:MbtH family protein [Chryseobacterium nematophagum]|uniref:MbtH family protein n=1 Tax=Chryseobacterium nematophagum TaxID=2305228 RepID=A0A3M7L7Q1_9FLAO|nr:MbtH family NRPS accessory protein [Chryseobacterium nematophagum]RMZ58788.1 MbtH family protein [Chryseobacterium nematophagum]